MSTRRALSIAIVTASCLLVLNGCKSNQTQQQSSSMPTSAPSSSGGGQPGGSSAPSSPGPSGGRSGSSGSSSPTSGSGLPSGGSPGSGLPSGGSPGSSFPSGGGLPGSGPSVSLPGPGIPGPTGSTTGNQNGEGGGRPGSPGDESPIPGQESGQDSDGDGIPDTAQQGAPSDDVDFSEASGGGSPAASREEQVAVLDQELEGSMRDYDGRILEERAGVLGRANQTGAQEQLEDFDRSVSYYDEAEEGDLSDEAPDADAPPPARAPQGNPGLPTSGRTRDVNNTPPDDIPSGDDDDVVARQIREAAMKETDPELREALWEEYRKYKNQ